MARVENSFAEKVDKYLKSIPDLWFLNTYGNAVQRAGIPDRLVCYKGEFIALELKRPDGKGKVDPRQAIEIKKINRAGGKAYIIDNLESLDSVFK